MSEEATGISRSEHKIYQNMFQNLLESEIIVVQIIQMQRQEKNTLRFVDDEPKVWGYS